MVFLQTLAAGPGASLASGMLALVAGVMLIMFIILAAIYLYFSIAFMSIGKKAKLKNPGVAWINPIVTIFEVADGHWWPFPVLLFGIFLAIVLMTVSITLGGILYAAAILQLVVMSFIWMWKTFEAVKKPGWWALSPLILLVGFLLAFVSPVLGILLILGGMVLYAVLVGVAAWS